jgi:RND family efflux transporter MFP subunit
VLVEFAFVFASAIGVAFLTGEDFFPQVDAGQFRLHVRAPAGTRIEETAQIFDNVSASIRSIVPPQDTALVLDNIGLPLGGVNLAFSDSSTIGPADGEILVSLKSERQHSTFDYIREMRRQLRASVHVADAAPPVVTVTFPLRAGRTTDLVLPGSIQAAQETAIYARVDGYLKRRLVNIGDQVRSGQLLAEIDTPELNQQLSQAKAAMAQSVSVLGQARAALQHTEAQLEYNRTTLERWRTMKERDLVAQQDLDDRQVLVKSGQADLDAASANVAAAEANVAANKANVDRLLELQSFQSVRAPFTGVITVRNVDNGALITAGSGANNLPLLRMAQIDNLRIFVNVPQTFVPSMAPGLTAEVLVREFPRRTFRAQVAGIACALDPASRTLLAEVHMRNEDNLLRPGMYADVSFRLTRAEPPLIVPASALIIRSGPPRVATVGADSRVRFRNVQLGRDYGTSVEIVDGLSEQDRLLVAPPEDVKENDVVRAVASPGEWKS